MTITCEGSDGAAYTDKFDLDVDVIRGRTYVTSSKDPAEQMKDIKKNIAGINQAAASIAQTLRNLSGEQKKSRLPSVEEVIKTFPGLTPEQLAARLHPGQQASREARKTHLPAPRKQPDLGAGSRCH